MTRSPHTVPPLERVRELRYIYELTAANQDGELPKQRALDIVALCDAYLRRVEADEWRPIESAPRDGTVIWAWRRGECAEAYLGQRNDCEMWYFGGTTAAEENFRGHKPTHWRPLPSPPPSENSTGGGKSDLPA